MTNVPCRSRPSASQGESSARSAPCAGFTLVELLVAFTLLGLIALMAAGGLRLGSRVWERTTQEGETSDRIAAVQGLIRRQLAAVVEPRRQVLAPRGPAAISGSGDAIELVAPLPFGRDLGALYRQRFALAETDGGLSLMMSWRPLTVEDEAAAGAATGGAGREALLDGVAALRWSYLAVERGRSSASWRETWDRPGLPQLVRLRLELVPEAARAWPELVVAPRAILPLSRMP